MKGALGHLCRFIIAGRMRRKSIRRSALIAGPEVGRSIASVLMDLRGVFELVTLGCHLLLHERRNWFATTVG